MQDPLALFWAVVWLPQSQRLFGEGGVFTPNALVCPQSLPPGCSPSSHQTQACLLLFPLREQPQWGGLCARAGNPVLPLCPQP